MTDKPVTTQSFGPKRHQGWALNEDGVKVPTFSKRTFFQRLDKMESMSVAALSRYAHLFRNRGLILADFIVLRRLGVKL